MLNSWQPLPNYLFVLLSRSIYSNRTISVQLSFEQNIATSSKILSVIGRKELLERKLGEIKKKIDWSLIYSNTTPVSLHVQKYP